MADELERVAMAICNWHGCPPDEFARMAPVERELALDRARVAIDAMRGEPAAAACRQWRIVDPATLKARGG